MGTRCNNTRTLLGRLSTGWTRNNKAFVEGVGFIARLGPSKRDMYYNLFASQLMFRQGGDEWNTWNQQLQELLVKTQATAGHAKGSWPTTDSFSRYGGRLYETNLSILCLTVYYRHLAIFGEPRK